MRRLNAPEYGPLFHLDGFGEPLRALARFPSKGYVLQAFESVEFVKMEDKKHAELRQ